MSLADGQRDLTQTRIREGAMKVVARRGFDATIEEIADWCGISPRTVFRHYASHDALMVATVKAMFEATGKRPIPDLPTPEEDLDGWLTGLAKAIHTRNATILGKAFWDIHAPTSKGSLLLHEVIALRGMYRRQGVEYLVALAWSTAGGTGPPPEVLRLAFALEFSAFTTQALMIDFGCTPTRIGELTGEILRRLLNRAVREQQVEHALARTDDGRDEDGELDEDPGSAED